MKDKGTRSYTFSDPKERLKSALDTIESYTKKKPADSLSHTFFAKKEHKRFQSIVHFAKRFVSGLNSDSSLHEINQDETLLHAIDDVHRFQPLVGNKPSEDARTLAKRALDTISRYQKSLDQEKKKDGSWHQRLLTFLIKKKPQTLPETHCFQLTTPKAFKPLETKKVSSQKTKITVTLCPRVTDAFRMKAISLIKDHRALFSSIEETLATLRKTPIYPIVSREEPTSDLPTSEMITLEQRLSPFPGETLILRGSFKKDPCLKTASIPIANSFEIASESLHTGFPYPAQHHGWALSNTLVPSYLYRPENIPSLAQLLQKRENLANELLKRGTLFKKSQELWMLKIQAAKQRKDEYLQLHQRLAESILQHAPKQFAPQESQLDIEQFFSQVKEQHSPLEELSAIYHDINFKAFDTPYRTLQDAWLNQSPPELLSEDANTRLDCAKKILIAAYEIDETEKYPSLIGYTLHQGSLSIILQHFSATLQCPPPKLSLFEKKLQTAVLFQLESFLGELLDDTIEVSFETMKQAIIREIHILQTHDCLHPLCQEMEAYFAQYYEECQKRTEKRLAD